MQQHTLPYIAQAEEVATQTRDPSLALRELRRLSLDDFGLLMISLPNPKYPNLSLVLPAMASEDVQTAWTGASGVDLLKQTVAFTRILESRFVRHAGRPMQDATILDFGCGYGRILRMMYHYSDPDSIWGIDAWERSLATCREARMLGHLGQSERVPRSLPVGDARFDLAFSFSVFTHLAPGAAEACLTAVRGHMKDGGLFVPTIRPVEYWAFHDKARGTDVAARMMADHAATGSAYVPHGGPEGETYGDRTLSFDFFRKDGWTFLGYDWSLFDTFQVAVILRAT